MGHVIVSGNLKGGTGKSTIAVNVACALSTRGHGVALIDVDPQGTAYDWVRRGKLPVHAEAVAPSGVSGQARWLQRAADLRQAADVVLIDMPPSSASTLAASLMVADLLMIPITASAVDVPPTAEVLRLVRETREHRGGKPGALLVPNRVDPSIYHDDPTRVAFEALRERWAPTIYQHAEHASAFAIGSWIGSYVPGSTTVDEIIALVESVEQRLGLSPPAAEPAADDADLSELSASA